MFTERDPLADVVSPTSDYLKTVTADRDGYIIGLAVGLASYEGNPVASTATHGEPDLVVERDD